MMNKLLLTFTITFFYSSIFFPIHTMEMEKEEKSNFYSIYLPGLNGGGSDSFRANGLINVDEKNHKKYKTIGEDNHNDMFKTDLGQDNCINHFYDQLKKDSDAKDKRLLLSGTSQATASFVNYVGSLSIEEQKNIGCLILESVLGSGNSAIMHTIEHLMFRDSILQYAIYLPGARIWLPWAAKIQEFPAYNPWGIQALESAKKLSKDILVIIMHHINDPQLSINDARNLYCALRESGNNNTYLFECNNNNVSDMEKMHFDILNTDTREEQAKKIGAIQLIYQKHGLPFNKKLLTDAQEIQNNIDPKQFQPSVQEVKNKINQSTWKTRYAQNTIDILTFAAISAYVAYKYLYQDPAFLALFKR